MKTLYFPAVLFCLLAISSPSFATDYYFSNSGNDNNSGTTEATPFKTLAKASSMRFLPGDRLLFKRGETFRGELLMTSSGMVGNPIVIDSYGEGIDATISGSEFINNWTSVGNGIYKADCAGYPQMLFYKGRAQTLARYPNEGFLFIESGNANNGFSDNNLPNSGSLYVGAVAHVRTAGYRYEERSISVQSGKYLGFSKPTAMPVKAGIGYYLTDKREFVDAAGEYFYDVAAKQLFYKTPDGAAPAANTVEASSYDNGVRLETSANTVIQNIIFQHQQKRGVYVYGAPTQNLTISNCTFQNIFLYAVAGSNKQNVTIENNQFYDIWNTAIFLGGVTGLNIRNNTFRRIGIAAPGRATDDLIPYRGIDMNGSTGIISGNVLDSIGYEGIQFFQNTLVEKTSVLNFCMELEDGTGIGAWGVGGGVRNGTGCIVRNNIVGESRGNDESFPRKSEPLISGVGMDDNSGNAVIEANTVYNITGRGISIHNSSNNQIRDNTIFNCQTGALVFEHDNSGGMLSNNLATGNVLYSYRENEYILKLVNWHQTETGLNFGTFSGNYYINPYFDAPIYTAGWGTNSSGKFDIIQKEYSVKGWAGMRDAGAKSAPVRLQSYKVISYVGNDLITNGNFDSNINGWGCYAQNNTCSSVWQNNPNLDGGAVRVTSPAYDYGNFYNTRLIPLQKGKKYLLQYSVVASENKIAAFNIQDRSNWAQLTPLVKKEVATTRTDHQILVEPNANTESGQLTFYIGPQYVIAFSLDNIKLQEVTTESVDPAKQNLLFINTSPSSKTIPLRGSYTDVSGNMMPGYIELVPFQSKVLIFSIESALPITLLDIRALPENNANCRIEWTLGDAGANCAIELQKSVDGKTFETISRVNTSTGTLNYAYLDHDFSQTSFYRLKSQCAGEQVNFSKIVKAVKEDIHVAVYPNPVTGNKLNVLNNENYNLASIFNTDGKKLMETPIHTGKNILTLPETLTAGLYLLLLTGKSQSKTIKLLKR